MAFRMGDDIIFNYFDVSSNFFRIVPIQIVQTDHKSDEYDHENSSKLQNILKI